MRKIAPRHPTSNDRSLAVHALIEGDAIMLQTIWATKNLTQDDMLELARVSTGTDNVLAGVPLLLRSELLFPYTDGLTFVRQAFRGAGNSYAAIDELFKNPPESTAQVLHPDKYRNHVHPVDVQLGDIAASLGPDWRRVGGGVLGELDTRVLLQQWGSTQSESNAVASAWSGDRWQLVEKDGHTAIALRSTWESSAAANDFFNASARGLIARYDAADVAEASSTRQALTTSTAATDVRLIDQDVLVVIAFDRVTADHVVDAVTSFAL